MQYHQRQGNQPLDDAERIALDAVRAAMDESSESSDEAASLERVRARLRVSLANAVAEGESPRAALAGFFQPRARHWAAMGLALATIAIAVVLFRSQPDAADPDAAALLASGALPSRSLTPGATERISVRELCAEGIATSRPPIPADVRDAVLRGYQMENVPPEDYELDYLITPELGGALDARNLWPERYRAPVWNAGVKDELEHLLPQMVCHGSLDLATAQHDMAADWVAAYKKYFHTDRPVETSADSTWRPALAGVVRLKADATY
jgi:hypothetical protein